MLVVRYVMLQGVTVSRPQRESIIGRHGQERFPVPPDEQVLGTRTRIVS